MSPQKQSRPPVSRRLRPALWRMVTLGTASAALLAIALLESRHDILAGHQVLKIALSTSFAIVALAALMVGTSIRHIDAEMRDNEDEALTGTWSHPDGSLLVVRFVPDSGWWSRPPGMGDFWIRWPDAARLGQATRARERAGYEPASGRGTRWVIRELNKALRDAPAQEQVGAL